MLQMLTEIRRLKRANAGIFSQCFKVFLANTKLSTWEKASVDRMLATVFQCCLDDGVLTNGARDTFRKLASPQTFERLYKDRLLNGKDEPKEWTRNCSKTF